MATAFAWGVASSAGDSSAHSTPHEGVSMGRHRCIIVKTGDIDGRAWSDASRVLDE